MALPDLLQDTLSIPAVGAPMFLVSGPELVIAQCRAGVVGSFPSLNARGEGELDRWLTRIRQALDEPNPDRANAPFAVNLIVHRSNARLAEDTQACVRHQVPIVITSLGARPEVNDAIHSYGGIVFHDVINNRFAMKAIDKGADGVIAVAAGAGGHAGTTSPFALVQEIRAWFDGPVLLSGCIATGSAILAAEAMGADLAYIGSAFIATEEARAIPEYKDMIAASGSSDIIYTDYFSGVKGNYLLPSIERAGLDPASLASAQASAMDFGSLTDGTAKAWKDIWGSGQGIGAITDVVPAADRVARFVDEYRAARSRLGLGAVS